MHRSCDPWDASIVVCPQRSECLQVRHFLCRMEIPDTQCCYPDHSCIHGWFIVCRLMKEPHFRCSFLCLALLHEDGFSIMDCEWGRKDIYMLTRRHQQSHTVGREYLMEEWKRRKMDLGRLLLLTGDMQTVGYQGNKVWDGNL